MVLVLNKHLPPQIVVKLLQLSTILIGISKDRFNHSQMEIALSCVYGDMVKGLADKGTSDDITNFFTELMNSNDCDQITTRLCFELQELYKES